MFHFLSISLMVLLWRYRSFVPGLRPVRSHQGCELLFFLPRIIVMEYNDPVRSMGSFEQQSHGKAQNLMIENIMFPMNVSTKILVLGHWVAQPT